MFDPSLYFFFTGSPHASGSASGTVPLYLFGIIPTSGSVPLYLDGVFVSQASLPLYLQAPVPIPSSGNVDLSLFGETSGYSSAIGSVPLYISGTGSSGALNLFLKGSADPLKTSGSLNLFLQSQIPSITGYVNLSIIGGLGGKNPTLSNIPLYLQGPKGFNGAAIGSGYLNLALINNYNSSGAHVDLNTRGYVNTSGYVNMYLFGVSGAPNSNVNMYLYGMGIINNSVNLFARGYIN